MMSEVGNLVIELKAIQDSEDAWHGPGLQKILAGVTASQALVRPVPQYRSIWENVLHISIWEDVFSDRLEGGVVPEPSEGDWPPVQGSNENDWKNALREVGRIHERLIRIVSGLKDADLRTTVPGKTFNAAWMIHGIVRHHVYHAGQIALLKRLV